MTGEIPYWSTPTTAPLASATPRPRSYWMMEMSSHSKQLNNNFTQLNCPIGDFYGLNFRRECDIPSSVERLALLMVPGGVTALPFCYEGLKK